MVNQAFLVGRLGKDPDLRATQSGKDVCTFSLATSDRYKSRDGEWKDKTEWHTIVVWGSQARACSQYLKKGSSAAVVGKIQYRSYEAKDGGTKFITEINASQVKFLSAAVGSADEQEELL
jgi:single-strand DNA-binding protein